MLQKNYIHSFAVLTLFIVFLFGFSNAALAQEKFTATVNKTKVGVSEQFKVSFKINGNADSFEPPALNHFNVLSGPNKSSSMSWVNGKSSNSTTYSYVLSANRVGKYSIGTAKLKAGSDTYHTKPLEIEITKANTTSKVNTAKNDLSDQVFLKCYTTKRKATIGEQIVATYKLYYKINLGNVNIKEIPAFNGFWSEVIEIDPTQNRSTEIINGVSYNVAIIHKCVLFPQRTGELELSPLIIDLMVQVKDNSRRGNVFDQFFGRYKNIEYQVKSTRQKINISPLPLKEKPADFSGAVGKFSFSAKLDRNTVKSNEAINLKVTINGTGNIKLISAPVIKFPSDFEVYDPKTNDRTAVTGSGVSGKKTFEYLMIPRHGGDFELPPIEFTYYDINKKKYITQKSEPFTIHVEKAEGDNATVSKFSDVNKSEINVIGSDIRFINTTNTELTEKGNFFFGSKLFYILLILPFLLFIGFLATHKKITAYNSNTALLRGKKANKTASKRLKTAQKHLNKGETKILYEEIFKAIYGYLSDKLTIDIAQLSKDNIEKILLEKGVNTSTINTLKDTLNNCEMARFSPVNQASEEEIYQKAVDIISKIEEDLK